MGNAVAPQIEEPESIDFSMFSGKWYQIARNSNPFQHPQAKNSSSEYSLNSDGSVRMIHEETLPDGNINKMENIGQLDPSGRRIFTKEGFNYIYDFDNKRGSAIIGDPVKGFFWILFRSPFPEAYDYHMILNKLKKHGIGFEQLIATYHD